MTSPEALVSGDVFVTMSMALLIQFGKLVTAPAYIKPFAYWTNASNRQCRLTST